ncbi:MAG: hypothetical protein M1825_000120 [Sarcosagium campestre]|nr:MAG: hypothetical protein M1825_000120 [Sarcosagium campestre]
MTFTCHSTHRRLILLLIFFNAFTVTALPFPSSTDPAAASNAGKSIIHIKTDGAVKQILPSPTAEPGTTGVKNAFFVNHSSVRALTSQSTYSPSLNEVVVLRSNHFPRLPSLPTLASILVPFSEIPRTSLNKKSDRYESQTLVASLGLSKPACRLLRTSNQPSRAPNLPQKLPPPKLERKILKFRYPLHQAYPHPLSLVRNKEHLDRSHLPQARKQQRQTKVNLAQPQ